MCARSADRDVASGSYWPTVACDVINDNDYRCCASPRLLNAPFRRNRTTGIQSQFSVKLLGSNSVRYYCTVCRKDKHSSGNGLLVRPCVVCCLVYVCVHDLLLVCSL